MEVRVLPPVPFSIDGGRSSTVRALDCGSSDVGSNPIDHPKFTTKWRVGRVWLMAAVPKTARAASPPGFESQALLQCRRSSAVRASGFYPVGRGFDSSRRLQMFKGGPSWTPPLETTAFEVMSKRRKGYPSESRVKRGTRIVHGDKELEEKLGRNDLCPCDSGRRFQELLHAQRTLSTAAAAATTSDAEISPS